MISLKNLHEHTEQEIFEQVAKHLLQQRARSHDGYNCLYRGPLGRKCAAGCLISDDEFEILKRKKPEVNNHSWAFVVENWFGPASDDNTNWTHAELIGDLQTIHDYSKNEGDGDYNYWAARLRLYAEEKGFNHSFIKDHA